MKLEKENGKRYYNIHQDLIDRCRKGDQKAQFQVYKLYYRSMFNTSLRIVNNTSEAEDVMQESFLAAFEKIETYSGKVSFGAWLKKIVINHSLDLLRKRKAIIEPIDDQEEHVSEIMEEEDLMDVETRIAEIRKGINKLPDGYRVVLSLHLLEGYDHDEIAEILGISPSTSRSQYTRAKQKLVSTLNKKT